MTKCRQGMDRKEYQKEWIRKKWDKGKELTLEEMEWGSTKRAKVLPHTTSKSLSVPKSCRLM